MNDPELERAIAEFTGAFEVVFGTDWNYTSGMMRNPRAGVPPGATFIKPDVPLDNCNWGARAALLNSYQRLLVVMESRNVKPLLPVADDWFHFDWPKNQ